MVTAVKIIIDSYSFLLPDTHEGYEFPGYVLQHKGLISDYILASKMVLSAASEPFSVEMQTASDTVAMLKKQLVEFKERTGIMGFPFDLKDVDQLILANNIDVAATVDL